MVTVVKGKPPYEHRIRRTIPWMILCLAILLGPALLSMVSTSEIIWLESKEAQLGCERRRWVGQIRTREDHTSCLWIFYFLPIRSNSETCAWQQPCRLIYLPCGLSQSAVWLVSRSILIIESTYHLAWWHVPSTFYYQRMKWRMEADRIRISRISVFLFFIL